MKDINTENFKKEVMDYTKQPHKFIGKKPVIVKMGAPWCGPCNMLEPVLEQLEKEYEGKFEVLNVNIDEEYEPAAAFGIRSIPNMIFFPMEGDPERMVGALPKKAVKDAIDRVFKL